MRKDSYFLKYQMKILELKNVQQLKWKFHCRISTADLTWYKNESVNLKIDQRRMKKNEDSTRDL